MSDETLNFSNNTVTTQAIESLISVFEDNNIFEYWKDQVVNPSITTDASDNLKRNFPRANYLRELLLKLAWSIPLPEICAATEDAGDNSPEKVDGSEAEPSPLDEKLKEMMIRRNWEGSKDFLSAIIWWRVYVLLTGDLFIKLPLDAATDSISDDPENEKMLCYPERMPAQRTYIKMNPSTRKVIDGYRFMYYLGTGQYTENGDMSMMVVEYVTKDLWTISDPISRKAKDTVHDILARGRVNVVKTPVEGTDRTELTADGGTVFDTHGILCVSHLSWEEREESARGIPLAKRIMDKALHVYSIQVDRRLGGKMGSVPMYVLKNSQGSIPSVGAGAVFSLKTEVPWAPADFSAVQTNFDSTSLEAEYKDALREMYHAAFLPFEQDHETSGDKSGVAIQELSKDQIKYREAFQSAESQFLKDLFSKAATLEGLPTDPDDISVTYDGVVTPNATERLAEAQFWMSNGYDAKAFSVMGMDDSEAQDMIRQKEDKQAEMLLGSKTGGGVDENGDPLPPFGAK